jgi:hypothetical protein
MVSTRAHALSAASVHCCLTQSSWPTGVRTIFVAHIREAAKVALSAGLFMSATCHVIKCSATSMHEHLKHRYNKGRNVDHAEMMCVKRKAMVAGSNGF